MKLIDIPHDHGGSDVERERQLIGFDLVRCGIDRPQICANGKRVLARHLRVGGIGHRWVQANVPAAATVTQRRYEIIVRPGADSGFRVRRNVRSRRGYRRASATRRRPQTACLPAWYGTPRNRRQSQDIFRAPPCRTTAGPPRGRRLPQAAQRQAVATRKVRVRARLTSAPADRGTLDIWR